MITNNQILLLILCFNIIWVYSTKCYRYQRDNTNFLALHSLDNSSDESSETEETEPTETPIMPMISFYMKCNREPELKNSSLWALAIEALGNDSSGEEILESNISIIESNIVTSTIISTIYLKRQRTKPSEKELYEKRIKLIPTLPPIIPKPITKKSPGRKSKRIIHNLQYYIQKNMKVMKTTKYRRFTI